MKKVVLILAVCLLIASCSVMRNNDTVDINDLTFDTLRVNVLIIDGDTLSATIDASEVD